MKVKVSIIVPNYNHALFLEQRLQSILNQTVQNFEMIILDDNSTDDSWFILKQYQGHQKVSHLIINEENSGSPFKQWQKGIALAQGEYIWIAESDDYAAPEFLEKVLKQFEKNSEIGVVYVQSEDVDEHGEKVSERLNYTTVFNPNIWEYNFNAKGDYFIQEYLSQFNVIPNASAVVFKRDIVKQSFFTTDILQMRMCGDWLFWIKILETTHIGFIAEKLNYFRTHLAISRNHNQNDKKIQRLIEEKKIRDYLNSKGYHCMEREKLLYQNYLSYFKFTDLIFQSRNIKLTKHSYSSFCLKMISEKIKRKI
ncbi:glycosyltransferase family 2 protein [Flavobacterium chuncheonense]|uniref:Glycosyltransferase family 2 protein n=1 Tax=Flavobacterium chuncheonense TaxID=2026653 RepID=A0ABW5YJT2_9FLAO